MATEPETQIHVFTMLITSAERRTARDACGAMRQLLLKHAKPFSLMIGAAGAIKDGETEAFAIADHVRRLPESSVSPELLALCQAFSAKMAGRE